MSPLQRTGRIIAAIEDGLLSLLLGAVILLAFTQIALRNLADISFSWADPLLRVVVLWLALIGAIAATRDDNHIRIDLLSRYLPESFGKFLKRITDLFSALISGALAWHSARFVVMEQADGAIAFSNIPVWLFELILPLGFGIIALRFLINAIHPAAVKGPA